jgi:hypothetical protein
MGLPPEDGHRRLDVDTLIILPAGKKAKKSGKSGAVRDKLNEMILGRERRK